MYPVILYSCIMYGEIGVPILVLNTGSACHQSISRPPPVESCSSGARPVLVRCSPVLVLCSPARPPLHHRKTKLLLCGTLKQLFSQNSRK